MPPHFHGDPLQIKTNGRMGVTHTDSFKSLQTLNLSRLLLHLAPKVQFRMRELAASLMVAPPEKPLIQPLSPSISERDVCPSILACLPPSTCRSSEP